MKTKLFITITIVSLFNFISNAQTVKPKQTSGTEKSVKTNEIKKTSTSTVTIKVEHDENYQYYIVDSKTGERIKTLYGYSLVMDFSDGMAAAEWNGKWGYINTKGESVIVGQYDAARKFSEGIAPVKSNGKWQFIDKNNNHDIYEEDNWLKDLRFEDAYSFNEGLAAVKNHNNKWGFISKTAILIIDYQYEGAESFNEGLAAVKLNGKYGFINKENKVVIPFEFEKVKSFSNGLAEVILNGVTFSIDKTGKKVNSTAK